MGAEEDFSEHGACQWSAVPYASYFSMMRRIRPLEVRGFSRSSFDGLHPLPEKPEDPIISSPSQKVAFRYAEETDFVHPKPSSSPVHRVPSSAAEQSSGTQSLSENNSWSFSGNLTGRSSVYSWGNDDEFDKQASATVKRMFEEIDSILFEQSEKEGSDQLRDECSEWSTTFPHFRILGNQLLPPIDSGTEIILCAEREDTEIPASRVGEDISDTDAQPYYNGYHGLNICGHKLDVYTAPSSQAFIDESDPRSRHLTHLEEEIFAEDGTVEEYFAFDTISHSDNNDARKEKGLSRCQRHPGYPPVTPSAFFRDTILSEVFDQIWIELVATLRGLLKTLLEKCGKDLSKSLLASARQSEHTSSSILRTFSREGYSKIPHLPSQLRLKTASGPLSVSSDISGLKELITIRSVSLQHRAPSVAALTLREDEPLIRKEQARPVSSTIATSKSLANRPLSMRNSDHQLYNRMTSAKGMKRNGRLQPLQPLDRSKTPAIQDNDVVGEVLRGTRLQIVNDRLLSPSGYPNMSPQPWGPRNGMLPPIERMESMDTISLMSKDLSRSPKQRGTKVGTRASSAATDESRRPLFRDRISFNTDSRPNTTHSFRSETQHSLTRRFPTTPLGTTTVMSRNGMLGSAGYGGSSLGVLQGISMPVNSGHSNVDSHFPSHGKSVSFDGEPDAEDLVLWGQGPPLISHSRKGRANVR